MGPGAETTKEEAFTRRTPAARPAGGAARRGPSAVRGTAQVRVGPQDAQDGPARDVVDQVLAYVERRARQGESGQARGKGRQMAIAALLLDRRDPAGLDVNLERVARVYRDGHASTPAALKKHASEARAILRYGMADGEALPESAAALPGEGERLIARLDELIRSIPTREIFARRARHLSGQRGGRPTGAAFRVLSAVAKLKEIAGSGDPKAEAELRLVRTFLLET